MRAVERLGTWAEYGNELIRSRWGFQHSGSECEPSSVPHFSACDFSIEQSSIIDTRLAGPFLLSATARLSLRVSQLSCKIVSRRSARRFDRLQLR